MLVEDGHEPFGLGLVVFESVNLVVIDRGLGKHAPVIPLEGAIERSYCCGHPAWPYAGNRMLRLSRLWMRRIASPKSGATETTSTFCERATGCVSIESVTIRL